MAVSADRARERALARRKELAERQRHEARRRLLLRVLLPVLLVVVVVVVFVVVKVTTGGGSQPAAEGVIASGAAPASVVTEVTTIPTSAFDTAGAGSSDQVRGPEVADGGTEQVVDGKPRVLYVGGEFCPFCAAERWVVVASLSRFGTFSGLSQTNSSATDVYPNTATLSFHGATYTSDHLAFSGYETTDRDQQPLDTLPGTDEDLLKQFDAAGSIPFQLLGGLYTQSGASYSPTLLADKTHQQIADAIADPSTDIGKAVLAASNLYTARLCQLTDGQPGDVCSSSGVKAAAATLG